MQGSGRKLYFVFSIKSEAPAGSIVAYFFIISSPILPFHGASRDASLLLGAEVRTKGEKNLSFTDLLDLWIPHFDKL